jgi:membrane protease subunit HflC
MSARIPLIAGIVLIVLGILAYSATFTVHQTQQAIVLQFGDPKEVVTEPGLHFKLPFIQNVAYVDKRILSVDPPSQEILLRGNLRIVVDAFVRYRITNPLRFIQAVQTEEALERALAPIVNDAVRGVLGDVSLADVLSVRRAGLMEQIKGLVNAYVQGKREEVAQANAELQGAPVDFGIEIVDLRIGRADLAAEVSESVYERMRAERQRDAADFRAQGEEIKRTIIGQADREATVIRAEATMTSSIARGQGDAQRTAILNAAYGRDPEFFEFFRTMQAYRESIDPESSYMVLTTNSEFFRYFANSLGEPALPEAAPGAGTGAGTGGGTGSGD